MPIDPTLLAIMQCPACGGELRDDESTLTCLACGRRYPVVDGIPHMLIEEASPPDLDES